MAQCQCHDAVGALTYEGRVASRLTGGTNKYRTYFPPKTVHYSSTQLPRAASTRTNTTFSSICRHHPCPRPAFTPYPTYSPTPPASSASIPLAQLLAPRRRQRPGPLPAPRPGCTRLQTEPPWGQEPLHGGVSSTAVHRESSGTSSSAAVPSRQDLNDVDRCPALVMGLLVSLWRWIRARVTLVVWSGTGLPPRAAPAGSARLPAKSVTSSPAFKHPVTLAPALRARCKCRCTPAGQVHRRPQPLHGRAQHLRWRPVSSTGQ